MPKRYGLSLMTTVLQYWVIVLSYLFLEFGTSTIPGTAGFNRCDTTECLDPCLLHNDPH